MAAKPTVDLATIDNDTLEAMVKKAEEEAFGGTAASRMGGAVNAKIADGVKATYGFFTGLVVGNKSPAQKRAELLARLQQVN